MEETEEETNLRRNKGRLQHEVARRKESVQERQERVLEDRLRHQVRIAEETEEESNTIRELNREQMASWRDVENNLETEERLREERERRARRRERLRQQQEETYELQRAFDAEDHADIVPDVPQKELEVLAEPRRLVRTYFLAKTANETTVNLHDCGKMDTICEECGAKHLKKERPSDKKFTDCCNKGKVILPAPKKCPELLLNLLSNSHPDSGHFKRKIRNYNSALAFASMGANITTLTGGGPYCFRIHGQVYHRTSEVAVNIPNPKYAQLYFIEAEQASVERARHNANGDCKRYLMDGLDQELRQVNPYARMYMNMRQVYEREQQEAQEEERPQVAVSMVIHGDRRTHDQRRYNSPTTNEIGVVFTSEDGAPPENRDIRAELLIATGGNKIIPISTTKRMCDPMTYPLLFPNGEDGWDPYMPYTTTTRAERDGMTTEAAEEDMDVDYQDEERQIQGNATERDRNQCDVEEPEPEPEEEDDTDPDDNRNIFTQNRRGKRKRITQLQYYSYLMAIRSEFNNVMAGGPLTQQWIVDSYVKIESNRLKYLREHQSDLHVARYQGLTDYLNNRADMEGLTIGKVYILPSSFIGSPRAMKQAYQDAICICGKFGKPTYFLTMTCNPKWPEIVENLLPGQTASDRPDLVARVFYQKLKELIEDITKRQVLGVVVARIFN